MSMALVADLYVATLSTVSLCLPCQKYATLNFSIAEFSKDNDIQHGVLTMANATGNRTAPQFFIYLGPNLQMKGSSAVVGK